MEFLVPLLMWEKILRAIYAVSKQLQSKSTNLSASISLLGENVALISTLKTDFDLICQSPEDMAKKWGVEASFKETRTRTRKNFFDELSNDARLDSPRGRFRVHVFLRVVDTCLAQLKSRFESLHVIVDLFSFLFPLQLMELSGADSEIQVTKFTAVYNIDVSRDLLRQILAFKACAGNFIREAENPQDILNTIMKLELNTCFPDLVTAYFIFLTLPVTTAGNERSFSKLKLINTYLRSSMVQGRLSDLGLLSIERDRFAEVDQDNILRTFANAKARKHVF